MLAIEDEEDEEDFAEQAVVYKLASCSCRLASPLENIQAVSQEAIRVSIHRSVTPMVPLFGCLLVFVTEMYMW